MVLLKAICLPWHNIGEVIMILHVSKLDIQIETELKQG